MTQQDQSAAAPLVVCPRCVSQMLPLQRFGITIDQCTGCGGIFLDRGELEQLAAAEAQFYTGQAPAQNPSPAGYAQPAYAEPQGRRSFMTEIFGQGREHERRRHH